MTPVRLTRRQWQVLDTLAVLGHDASEKQVWREGARRRHWEESGPAYLHGHLRKLTDRGLVDRYGARGTYTYEINDAGRAALESFA